MPELPEVETIRNQLQKKIINKKIASIEVFNIKSVANDSKFKKKLIGKIITNIDRIGKLMIFSFKNEDDLYLLAHMKMTGQFFYVDNHHEILGGGHKVTASDLELPGRHTRVAFHFANHDTLYFNDMRLFGYTKLATANDIRIVKNKFGPEPINDKFDCDWFTKKLKNRKTPIKAALLDQSFIAGLGNIYADEALWRAKINPARRADKVTKKEAAALCAASGSVMKEAITVGGTTFQSFKDTDGAVGNFTNHLKVFGRQGMNCERCNKIILKIRCAGRGTHYCPVCQK